MDVAFAQPVLGAVLPEALAGVDHEDAAAADRVLLVDHHDARRDSGAVEEVGGKPDDALDQAVPDETAADVGLLVAAEEDAVRHDDRALAGAVERCHKVQEKGEIAVPGRRLTVFEPAVFIVGRVETVRPGLVGERGIGDREVEPLETPRSIREPGGGQRIVALDLGGRASVEDHVHAVARDGKAGASHEAGDTRLVRDETTLPVGDDGNDVQGSNLACDPAADLRNGAGRL